MNTFKRLSTLLVLGLGLFALSACANPSNQAKNSHSSPSSMAMEAEPAAMMEKEPVAVMEKMVEPKVAGYKAGEFQAYSKSAFDAAVADGKTVMLDFYADWCYVCTGNAPKLKQAFQELSDESVVGFEVNFDTEKELKKQYQIAKQSSYIVLEGGEIARRSIGPQSVESFKELLKG